MAPSPLSMGVSRNSSTRGKRRHFAYIFQVADDAVQMDVHKALYPFYTKRHCSIYGNIHKNALRWHHIASYIVISYKADYLQIFQAGTSLQRSKLPSSLTKPQLCLYFTQQDLPASLRNKNCKRLRFRPKQLNTLSINPCLSILPF